MTTENTHLPVSLPVGALRAVAADAKSWPFIEARRVLDQVGHKTPAKGYVLFETGYGPSGLPHIGTFGEVVRTSMVRRAFQELSDIPTRMVCVSDDMDGMRKIPDNVPNRDLLEAHLQKPLTTVPDPFGTHASFAHHNNARLCAFLDSFGFDYEFLSSTTLYKNGTFDAMLLRALERYDAIQNIMLPTLGEERRATYSPFLPISPKTGRVLYVPLKSIDAKAGTITFDDEDGETTTIPVTGGHTKLQWKPDFGMRWAALGVDFEMFGKDHRPNMGIYSDICSVLGVTPPVQYVYELFLDEEGQKISKSKGNGIALEQWLTYATQESLSNFMFNRPQSGKKLYFDVIPRAVDDYLTFVDKFPQQDAATQIDNPAWHIHAGAVPKNQTNLSFNILLNLAGVASTESEETLWDYIKAYAPGTTPENDPYLAKLVGYALRYYQDFVRPTKQYRAATAAETAALQALLQSLAKFDDAASAEEIQTEVYEVGKAHGFTELKEWFQCLYEVLLGQSQGPRMGTFIKLYGLQNTQDLIREKLTAKAA